MFMNELTMVQKIVVWLLPVVFAITVHEVAHGWVAKKFGDNTADRQGRLTLNPLNHIDLVGTVLLPGILLLSGAGFIFGWAKPVPVDPRNFKSPRKDMMYVAMAGPISNLLMALGWAIIARIGVSLADVQAVALPLIYSGIAGISINLVLALINFLPIPPLDGSRIVAGLLPERMAWQYYRLEPYGFYVLLLLLVTGGLGLILGYPMMLMQALFFSLAGLTG
ncbi:site-2 protease family protein [methane-oxidizing endosymbiont of Gigantopelta aegis]|uniref:site-2 protease family protein n=1 Tax=methane-oxidizing endosymbiont of Gigantopelta aegis TaxID=2794938 RepID=UPI0018DE7DEA|nr:site-2 protease family protein [methane-oxidizing endosymbiont of Gigantopelta aegis]